MICRRIVCKVTLFLNELSELICLLTVKWFQVSNTDNSIYPVILGNINNLHTAVWFQITYNNNFVLMIEQFYLTLIRCPW